MVEIEGMFLKDGIIPLYAFKPRNIGRFQGKIELACILVDLTLTLTRTRTKNDRTYSIKILRCSRLKILQVCLTSFHHYA